MTSKSKLFGAVVGVLLLGASSAYAGGFLADTFIKPFSPQLAEQADKLNAQLGHPVDRLANGAAGAVADAVVPGSAPVVTGALEAGQAANASK